MLVTPPQTPSRATGELDELLDQLGYRQLAKLSDEQEMLAEVHEELFEEIAAFARRGWAVEFELETGIGYDAEQYELILEDLLAPLGIRDVELHDDGVAFDGKLYAMPRPHQPDDWLDGAWILDAAGMVAREAKWEVVTVDDGGDSAIVGIVPTSVWNAIVDRGLTGAWRLFANEDLELN